MPSEITRVFSDRIKISEFTEILEAMDAGKGEVEKGLVAVHARFDKGISR